MNCLSLFDGIGGCRQALKNLNMQVDNYYSSEIDQYAIKVAKYNHPDIIELGDVNNIDFTQFIGKIDLLCAGFPCQAFSSAGNQKGFEDPRGMLFFKVIEAMQTIKPKYVLFENVNSMKKEYKQQLTKYVGFDYTMIDSALLTAQTRKRIYFVGALQEDGSYKQVIIPQPQDRGIFLKDVLESGNSFNEKSYCVDASYYKGSSLENTLNKHKRTLIAESIACAYRGRNIVDGKRRDIKGAKTEQQLELNYSGKMHTLTSVSKDSLVCGPIRLGHFNTGGQGDRIYSVEGKSVCLAANGGGRFAKTGGYKIDLPDGDYYVRKLTIKECCRLQAFPDDYFLDVDNNKIISNSQAYKCIGNSFTVNVIEYILSIIFH